MKAETAIVREATNLQILKSQFLKAAKAGDESIRMGLEQYRAAGIYLIKIKNSVGHGSFRKWVEEYCDYTERHCRRWMKLARIPNDSSLALEWEKICGRDEENDVSEHDDKKTETTKRTSVTVLNQDSPIPAQDPDIKVEPEPSAAKPPIRTRTSTPPEPPKDKAGSVVPERVLPFFEAAKKQEAVCRQIDCLITQIEEIVKSPGGRLIILESVRQHLKDAKGGIWGNRPTHVCPYCHGSGDPCKVCNGEGWTAKHVWQAAPRAKS